MTELKAETSTTTKYNRSETQDTKNKIRRSYCVTRTKADDISIFQLDSVESNLRVSTRDMHRVNGVGDQ